MRGARISKPGRRSFRQDGFTLIEVLVAFLVLAFGTLVIQQAVMTSVNGTRRASDRLRADLVARSLMTAPIAGDPGTVPQSGTLDGMPWTIRYEPLDLPFPTATDSQGKIPEWTPRRMIVTVPLPGRGAEKAAIRLETIRLVRSSGASTAAVSGDGER